MPTWTIRLFTLITLTFAAPTAPAKVVETTSNKCVAALKPEAVAPSRDDFDAAIHRLRAAGLVKLLEPLDRGALKVELRAKRFSWQSDVAVKFSLFGGKKLIVRRLDFSSERVRQISTWRLAEALYQARLQSGLLSSERYVSQKPYTDAFDADDAFEYFFARMPLEWRSERQQLLRDAADELYGLFDHLKLLDVAAVLPAKEPGRFSPWRVLDFGNDTRMVTPNQLDFGRWRTGGTRQNLFKYYLAHLRRIIRVTMMLQVLALAPHIPEIPTYFEVAQTQVLGHAVTVDPMLEHEYQRLKKEIVRQEKMPVPDQVLIASLKVELQDLVEAAPDLVYAEPLN